MGGPIAFKQNLRLFEAITIIVGSMIGSGILLLPADMAEVLPSPGLILLVMLAGAFLTILGCLTFAELSSMFPRAGGQYHFLKEGQGRFMAYLFGWGQFWVIQTGIIAGVAVAFARFLSYFVEQGIPLGFTRLGGGGRMPGQAFELTKTIDVGPCVETNLLGQCTRSLIHVDPVTVPAWGSAFVAIAVILLLALINGRSSGAGGRIQNIATVAKVIGLIGLVAIVFALGDMHPDAYRAQGGNAFVPEGMGSGALLVAFGSALSLSLFAFDGWPQATYVAGEVRNAKRNLPIALIVGPLVTSLVYVALTSSYFFVLPIDQAVALGVNDQRIAPEAAGAAATWGRDFISAVALVSVFGTVNGFLLTAPRIYYALARDGALLPSMGTLNRKQVPGWAIYFTAIWASLLVMTGGYQQLATMVVFGIFLFYIPTSLAHMRLRKTHAHVPRPYKTPLYPLVPILFLLASVFVVGIIYYKFLAQALVATALILLGVPFYFLQRRSLDRAASEQAAEAADEARTAQGAAPTATAAGAAPAGTAPATPAPASGTEGTSSGPGDAGARGDRGGRAGRPAKAAKGTTKRTPRKPQ